MDDKEKNRAICHELEKVASRVWEQVKECLPEGTYTANQVAELQPKFGNLDMAMSRVEVENFRLNFPDCAVFDVLHRAYRMAGINKERIKFTNMEEKKIKAHMTVRVEKRHAMLKNMVRKDKMEKRMENIYIDTERGYLIASDGFAMGAMKADIQMLYGAVDKGKLVLPPGFVDRPSVIDLTVYEDGTMWYTGDVGVEGTAECLDGLSYPKWWTVFPSLHKDMNFRLTKTGLKQFITFLKNVKKMKKNSRTYGHRVAIFFKKHAKQMQVRYDSEDHDIHTSCFVEMEKESKYAVQLSLRTEHLLAMANNWNGSFWVKGQEYSVVFDTDYGDTIICVPAMLSPGENYVEVDRTDMEFNLSWDKRYGEPAPEQKQEKQFEFMNYYRIEDLMKGTYKVRGERNEEMRRSIRRMAKEINEDTEKLRRVQIYLNNRYGTGEQARSHFPLEEKDILDALMKPLIYEDINEPKKEPVPKPVPKPVPEPVSEPVPEPVQEPVQEPAQEPEEEPEMKIERTTSIVGRRFFPLLVLKQGDTQVIVSGNSLYDAICDKDGTLKPMYVELFDSIDAFVEDELLAADELDEEAICTSVSEFMDMVESVRMNNSINQ